MAVWILCIKGVLSILYLDYFYTNIGLPQFSSSFQLGINYALHIRRVFLMLKLVFFSLYVTSDGCIAQATALLCLSLTWDFIHQIYLLLNLSIIVRRERIKGYKLLMCFVNLCNSYKIWSYVKDIAFYVRWMFKSFLTTQFSVLAMIWCILQKILKLSGIQILCLPSVTSKWCSLVQFVCTNFPL